VKRFKMPKFWVAIDRWWFSWGSPLPLALFRICIGFFAVVNGVLLSVNYERFFYESGFTPNALTEIWSGGKMINLLRGGVSDVGADLFLWVVIMSALCLCVGYCTRLAAVITTFGTMTLQHRNPFILQGADTLLRLCLIYLMFARSGAALSIDRAIKKLRNPDLGPPDDIPLWPQRLIAFQMAVMYLSTVSEKLLSIPWRDGTALYYVLRLTAYQRFPLPAFLSNPPMTAIFTYGTLVVETLLGLSVFIPALRKWAVPGGIMLHLGIFYAMNVPLFCELTLSLYILLFSGEEIKEGLRRMRRTTESLRDSLRQMKHGFRNRRLENA